ncbi:MULTISPECIES: ParB family protein [unclassified Vibrio]|uniref:ParB family protein n=1 Tax=unclassified Vibrio TaxID=2614977 RepID=UPI0012688962|nr:MULTISPECIES: ParB family protein [unclassified Vibrio]QFT40023.1 ParB family protein [Vibrio sp. THAF64]QGM37968.1 ParB family protein [Vibrio sp. THAF191d]QGN73452.1 ParB family protein [Vibrio sp. THAF191c]
MGSGFGSVVSKHDLLGKQNKGQQTQGNGLSLGVKRESKEFKLESGVVNAIRMVISADEVDTKTKSHPLNPRNQEALNAVSVGSTLNSVRENGIDTDCLGIWSDDKKTILVIEGSVRRFCAITASKDYPIWVLPANSASNKDIRRLVADAGDKKPHSWRERGKAYWSEAEELGKDPSTLKVDELAALLGVGRETMRKCIQAFKIDIRLLSLIPDYEGVPTSFYGKLAKVEKELARNFMNLGEFCKKISKQLDSASSMDVVAAQEYVMEKILAELTKEIGGSNGAGWETIDVVKFDSKDKHVRKSVSPNGRTVKFELSRIDTSIIDDIEQLLKDRLGK